MGKTLGTKRMSLTNESLYTGEQTLRCNAVLVSLMRSEGLHKSEVADQGAYGWTEQQHVMRKTCLEVAWKPQSQRNKPRSGPGLLGANSCPLVVLSKNTKTHTKKKQREKKKNRSNRILRTTQLSMPTCRCGRDDLERYAEDAKVRKGCATTSARNKRKTKMKRLQTKKKPRGNHKLPAWAEKQGG